MPSLQIDVDYLPEPSGFVPWDAPADANHRSARQRFEATALPCLDGIAAQISMVELWHRTGLPPDLVKHPR